MKEFNVKKVTDKPIRISFAGVELTDIEEVKGEDVCEEKMKFYSLEESLKILFISINEFTRLKVAKTGKVWFSEEELKHFFDNAENDEMVRTIKANARLRYFAWKNHLEISKKFFED